ncbi:transcription termination factor Rho [Paraeggerthella hongkongensis]|uniref:transcription termination factor Rho n=1 Tax=Paraeggerthella sp. TaxID=2897350 RepID=UPI000DF7F884|nr:transcription termination factor Rho [Paraeggerthella hongkongensis]
MSENEASTAEGAPEAPSAPTPRRRRSTSVRTKSAASKAEKSAEPAKADAGEKPGKEAPAAQSDKADSSASERPAQASKTPRKSTRANGKDAASQPSGSTNRRPNQGQSQSNKGGSNQNNRQRQNNNNRQKQGGQQNGGNQNFRRQRRPHSNQGGREMQPSVSRDDLNKLKVAELREKAAELQIDVTGLKKAELVEAVFEASVKAEGFIEVSGILDILADGYGFLRTQGYLPSESDCYVGLSTIRRNGLRKGDLVSGQTRPARENEKYAAIQKVTSVNGTPIEELGNRVRFGDLTPVYPDECLSMEHGKNTVTARVIDLVSPIGKGQRGLIVSPPKAGKTTILKDIAAAISANNPEVHLMCLLVDERPEEVTDMERSIKGEVISSTFDMPTENHIAVSELVIERAKRLVECGKDVVVLLDSLTRLARAYNLAQPASGRILSGGVDSTALYPPKRFLGAARNIEHGGSLTILASALVDTGSKMDEVIFEEFKGTGNMELKLDRNLADRRIFPAIDPVASGTRKEDLLLDPQEAPLIWAVRRILANTNSTERAMDMLIKSLKQTETNQEFLVRTAKKAQHTKADGTVEF